MKFELDGAPTHIDIYLKETTYILALVEFRAVTFVKYKKTRFRLMIVEIHNFNN